MKVSVSREKLAAGLAAAARALPARPAQPVFSGVTVDVLEVDDGRHVLVLVAGDGENWVRTRLECTADEPGQVVVNGHAFADLVKDIPGDVVDLVAEGELLSIQLKKGSYSLPVYKEGPAFAPSLDGRVGSVSGADLAAAVAQVAVAAARSETLPVLAGVRMEIADGQLVLAATDRYRLSTAEVSISAVEPVADAAAAEVSEASDASEDSGFAAVVPLKQLSDVARLFSKAGSVMVSKVDGAVAFATDETAVHARLLAGEYPAWRRLLAAEPARSVTVSAVELAGAVRRASRINPDVVSLLIGAESITVAGSGQESGSGSEEVTAVVQPELDGDPVTVLFNPGSLLDGLNSMAGDAVTIGFTDPVKPFLLQDGSPHVYLAMPRR